MQVGNITESGSLAKIAVFQIRTQVGATKEPTIFWPNVDAL